MKLHELAYAHCIYLMFERYDDSYKELTHNETRQIRLDDANDIENLLLWLNKWGCRHISKKCYPTAIRKLRKWWNDSYERILSIMELENSQLITLFDDLSNLLIINETNKKIHLGPTAAAKTLFAVNPNRFIPWDVKIRKEKGDDGEAYVKFLQSSMRELEECKKECKEKGKKWDLILKEYFGNPASELKLIDEYYWLTITRNFVIDREEIIRLLNI